jgi:gliding motility-associated-like protein
MSAAVTRSLSYCIICLLALLLGAMPATAQCLNWSAKAQLTTASTCASNGAFSVTLSGPDVANLSNIQFGIPIAANGYSVPLNSSPNFTGVPPGSYTVSVVADCNGNPVGRNATVVVPGNYVAPTLTIYKAITPSYYYSRASLSCMPTGKMYVLISGGVYPYTLNFTSYPAAYTGRTTFVNQFLIDSLPPGVYTMQLVDACMTGSVPKNDTIASLNPALAPYVVNTYFATGCDTLVINAPLINGGTTAWAAYTQDTGFKVSMSVSGGIASSTPQIPLGDSFVRIKLPTGKTIKDLYGETITYTITPPCGPNRTLTQVIQPPSVNTRVTPNCNINFALQLDMGMICLPVTYNLLNTSTITSYGPYTSTTGSYNIPSLPFGNYTVSYTTGDGYTGSRSFTAAAPSANPYTVSVVSGAVGLNGYAGGFTFTTNPSTGGGTKTVELFSGPSGYSYLGLWNGTSPFTVSSNQTPTASTLKFPAGSYVWKITDACGTYYLPISVTAADLYQFTVGTPAQRIECAGLWITPTGTASNNGTSKPVGFAVMLNGAPIITSTPTGNRWVVYPLGTPILLTAPGTYTIVPSATTTAINLAGYYISGSFTLSYPNIYTSSYSFTYSQQPLSVDINKTQGFICKGAAPGQAQIYAGGKNGVPFYSPPSPHYRYFLALPNNAVSGPYIDSNSTGVFTGFGGNANALYDLKVVDTCGAFAVQQVKILDLGTARLISSSSYVSCTGGQVQLSAIYLPGATYAWAGPNGFSSNVRQPILTNTTLANTGTYFVTITTTQCNLPVTDSTTLVLAGGPPKPLISYLCLPKPVTLSVVNASPGVVYSWSIGRFFANTSGLFYSVMLQPSDTPWTKEVWYTASYRAVATDTITHCYTLSDSLLFLGDPDDTLVAAIYSPHLQVCAGDTTVLVARGQGTAVSAKYQWYRNGLPIPGATGISYAAWQSGSYRVFIDAGLCNRDTSAAVTVSVIPYPSAAITAPKLRFCQGDTSFLQATTGVGYTYTWYRNGTTIPGAFLPVYPATTAGIYHVVISNGGCIATAPSVSLTVVPLPVVTINPATTQYLCPGDSIRFTTSVDTGYRYRWERNGVMIAGATADSFYTRQAGTYQVFVATSLCPYTPSPAVPVRILPTSVNLGPDTTDCNLPSSLVLDLQVDSLFQTIMWSSGQSTPAISTTGPGIYWVRAANGCGVFSDTLHVSSISDFLPGLPQDTLICSSIMSATLSVPSRLQNIKWSTGASGASVVITTPGEYSVSGHSPCGLLVDTIRVDFCAPDISGLRLSADSLCEGDCLTPEATVSSYPKTYQWIFEGGTPSSSSAAIPGTICYPKAGIYTITLIASNIGGSDTAQTTVVVSAKPQPRFKDTLFTLPYQTLISIPACASARHVDWYIGDSLICADCPELKVDARFYFSQYRCMVRNGNCPDSCNYTLRVIDIPHDLWLPDGFTPNGDDRNDIFRIITDNPNIQVINLSVYNRWGQRIFLSNANNGGWDGTFGGSPAPFGTYFWQLRYKVHGTEEVYFKKGDVLLVR